METTTTRGLAADTRSDSASTPWREVAAVALLLFSILALLQAMAAFDELQRAGRDPVFGQVLLRSAVYYPPWVLFSVTLFVLVDRRRAILARPAAVFGLFAASLLLFFLPYLVYEAAVVLLRQDRPLTELPTLLAGWSLAGWFVDLLLFCGCFASIYGIGLIRDQLARERRQRQLEADMLALTIELERQRLAALQAQLEPHFLFNALSAISGLVRTEDKRTALNAIGRLSDLLRYALLASRRDWVTLDDELRFVRDYLDLQRLRHGERMRVVIEEDADVVRSLDCPPLLLQPLIENALRHDLEAHAGACDIRLTVAAHADGVRIQVSNSLHPGAAANPGLGLGLSSTRERLMSRYGSAARLETRREAGRFEVELLLPDVEHA